MRGSSVYSLQIFGLAMALKRTPPERDGLRPAAKVAGSGLD
jgi:hypothetical protein